MQDAGTSVKSNRALTRMQALPDIAQVILQIPERLDIRDEVISDKGTNCGYKYGGVEGVVADVEEEGFERCRFSRIEHHQMTKDLQ